MLGVVAIFLLGVAVARVGSPPPDAARTLDWFVVRIALPALVVERVSRMPLDSDAAVPVVVAWSVVAGCAVAVWVIGRAAGWSRRTVGTLLLVVPLGNTSFLGFPAIEALLGADHIAHAVLYDQLGTFLALATYGTWVAGRWGSGGGGGVRRVVTFPPFLALLVALALRGVDVGDDAMRPLELLGACVGPVALFSIGLRARVPTARRVLAPAAVGLGLRLLVAPAAVLGAAALLDASGPAWATAVLEAGMPPMITAGIVAVDAGLDEELATFAVSAGLLLSLLTLPFLAGVVPL